MTAIRDIVELVRAPAALTVPGDSLAGAAATGWPAGLRIGGLPAASACLYWAGMALNDYADRELDAVERPERPIPSGRVGARSALRLAIGLSAAGVVVAGLCGGRRSAVVASTLAATVWAYDLADREGPISVGTMAATRGLDVLLGAAAGTSLSPALLPAGLVASHTASVTALSRGEVHGSTSSTAWRCVATTAVTAGVAALTCRGARPVAQVTAVACAAGYAVATGAAQLRAARSPDAATVRATTGAGVRSVIWLQAALVAGRDAPLPALGVLSAGPLARLASKVVSVT